MQNIEETTEKIEGCESNKNTGGSIYKPSPENEMDGLGYTSHSDWGYSGWSNRPSGWTGGGWDY